MTSRDFQRQATTLIDDLKGVNDTLGHEAGDKFIKRMAVVMRATGAPEDVPTRLGGDEFAIVVPDTDAEGLAASRCRGGARRASGPPRSRSPARRDRWWRRRRAPQAADC